MSILGVMEMGVQGNTGLKAARLRLLGAYFKEMQADPTAKSPTITELAVKLDVTCSTIYTDLELLRSKLGSFVIPIGLKLGKKKFNDLKKQEVK